MKPTTNPESPVNTRPVVDFRTPYVPETEERARREREAAVAAIIDAAAALVATFDRDETLIGEHRDDPRWYDTTDRLRELRAALDEVGRG